MPWVGEDGIEYAWTRYEIWYDPIPRSFQRWRVNVSTNDNYDTGYPGEYAEWELRFPTIDLALKHTGMSRQGVGHKVMVWCEDMKINVGVDVTAAIERAVARYGPEHARGTFLDL